MGGVESILGPIGEMGSPLDLASNDQDSDSNDEDSDEGDDDQTSVDVALDLNGAGRVSLDETIDQPITSGGDGGFNDGLNGPF